MLPQDIKKQYDTSRARAEAEAAQRKHAAYTAMPRLRQIDEEIRQVSFNRGLELIKAENRDQVRRDTAEKLAALYAERARMLSERGMSMDDLLPRYACEKCSDTGYLENGELCPCARLKLAGRKYSSSGISENAGFDRFNENIFKDPEQLKRTRRAAEICAQYAENLEIGGAKGLLLMGETGLGKTFLMDSIGREAIRQAMTERQFFDALRKKGYAVKVGKDISVRPPGKERFVRLMRNFGEDYSLDNIRRRILAQSRPERKKPEQKPEILRVRLIGSLKTARKLTGFRALYVHYCYLLGIFPKKRPQQSRKRLHFLLREDLLKLDAITAETRLLIGHRIDTAEQLFRYRDEVSGKITALTEKRKQLYKSQRTAAVKSDPEKAAEVKAQIDALSKELAALRKEGVLCNSIAERSGVIQEKIKAVREDEQPERKEKTDHVQFR